MRLRDECQVRLINRLEITMSPLQSIAVDESAKKRCAFLDFGLRTIFADRRIPWCAICTMYQSHLCLSHASADPKGRHGGKRAARPRSKVGARAEIRSEMYSRIVEVVCSETRLYDGESRHYGAGS